MANALASLKSLACPAGDSCTAFQCLFSHSRDRPENIKNNCINVNNSTKHTDRQDAPTTSRTHPAEDTECSMTDQPRKKARLGVNSTATLSRPEQGLEGSVDKEGDKQRNGGLGDTSATMQNGGSPAVLKPKSPVPSKVTKQTSNLRTKTQPPVNNTRPAPPPAKPVTQPKQTSKAPESLNPRLLRKAPATHANRVALVKAMHQELQRLNNELKTTATDAEKRLLLSDQQLIARTLDTEQEIATKKTAIYATSIRSRIQTYKKMTVDKWKEERSKEVDGDKPASVEQDAKASPIVTGLTAAQEVEFLSRYYCDMKALEAHGFISKIPTEESIKAAVAGVKSCGNSEVCDRCTRRFQVFPGRRESDGALASNGPCVHHPGKAYYADRAPADRALNRDRERKYRCCERPYDDPEGGCATSPHHVFKTTDPDRLGAVLNFVETPHNSNVPKDRAVAFDCEMGYTVFGLEIIRLTAVSWPDGDILLDILVQPTGEILDLNTRYSGVQPEDIALAEPCGLGSSHEPTIVPPTDPAHPTDKPRRRLKIAPSPKVARDLFFTIVSNDTPLIGHGLENDLNALRIVHSACVDTAILYPHPRGLPMRMGLKVLMERNLKRTIQAAGLEGHDSAEDAKAAGDLVRLKIKDDWKELLMKGWFVNHDGKFEAPGEEWTVVGGAKVKKRGF